MPPNPCGSPVCKAQIQAAYTQIKAINHIVRTLTVDIEDARIRAQRHDQHVKYVTKHMFETGGGRLDDEELRKLMLNSGGEYPVFEVPDDISAMSSELSVGLKLPEESLSSDGMDTM